MWEKEDDREPDDPSKKKRGNYGLKREEELYHKRSRWGQWAGERETAL